MKHLCPHCTPESGGCGGNHIPPTREMTEIVITGDFALPENFSLSNETRWLVKENHEKILQRMWFGDRGSMQWEDVPTVYEKGLEK